MPERLRVATAQGWQPSQSRRCYFGPAHGWIDTDVLGRSELANARVAGPAIIEEDNCLTVVLPGWHAALDAWSNIVLEVAT